MDEEEVQAFEQRMRENAALAHAVHMHKDVLRGIEYHFMNEIKAKLIASDRPTRKKLPTWAIVGLIVVGVAAAIAAYYFL